jgi:hypothetical protein
VYTKILRDVWGYCIIFRGVAEVEVEFDELFDPN